MSTDFLRKMFLSCFGLGFLPAPGTWGSAFGLLIIILFGIDFKIILILLPLCLYLIPPALNKINSDNYDPSWIVIDEFCGIIVAFDVYRYFIDYQHIVSVILIFFFFRLFDILKPFPIGYVDEKLCRTKKWAPLGIMFDDILAGILAGLCAAFTSPPTACF